MTCTHYTIKDIRLRIEYLSALLSNTHASNPISHKPKDLASVRNLSHLATLLTQGRNSQTYAVTGQFKPGQTIATIATTYHSERGEVVLSSRTKPLDLKTFRASFSTVQTQTFVFNSPCTGKDMIDDPDSIDLVDHAQDLLSILVAYASNKVDSREVRVPRWIAAHTNYSC